MPKEKFVTRCIPNIYKRNAENIMLFCWVKSQQQIVPAITVEQAITNFFKFSCISIDEWDMESAKMTYYRLQCDYYNDCRS